MEPNTGTPDTITLENWVDEAVMSFIIDMKYKLRLNNHKGHWQGYDGPTLFDRINDEVKELEGALAAIIKTGPSQRKLLDIVHECADIANFAMMLADNAKREMRKNSGQG